MRQFFKITGIILLALVLLIVGLFFYLQTSAGQNFLTQRVTSYLKSKIDKPFSIKKISYKIPDWIALEGVYFSDNQGDTLIDGQKLYVNMDMLGLLKNQVSINEINLENININIKRTLPDTTFNFAYILKSFETPNTNTKIDTAKGIPLKYKISNIKLKNVRIKYLDDVTGVDAKVYLSNTQTSFSDFDPATSKYHLDKLALDGGNMNLRLFASIPSTKKVETTPSDTLDFSFTEFDAKNINWKITEETSGLVNSVKLGRLNTKASQVYLSGEKIHLKSVDLYNTDASVTFLRKKSIQKTANPTSAAQPNNWKVLVDKIIFDKNNITYQDQNQPLRKKGIDYNNLKINNLNLNLERLLLFRK